MNDFNLIVSSSRFREEETAQEILDLLDLFGDPAAEIEITEVKGIILAKTVLAPLKVVEELKRLVVEEPWEIHHVMRVIPIERVVQVQPDKIRSVVEDLSTRLRSEDSFRVTVERRHNTLNSIELIRHIAERIKCKVNLTAPDWIVLIEIVGNHAGVSILRKDQIFSSVVEKRNS